MTVHALRTDILTIDAESFVRGLPSAKNERFKYTDLSVFEKQAFLPNKMVGDIENLRQDTRNYYSDDLRI